MTNQKLTALQTTVVAMVAIFMFGKAVVEIYRDLGKFAYSLGQKVGNLYYSSKYYNRQVSDVTVAVEIEAKEVHKQVVKTYRVVRAFVSAVRREVTLWPEHKQHIVCLYSELRAHPLFGSSASS